ncbi:FadR/GntR family transcriptional regulator [Paucisalibacillus sp. EB02]|uniref:FadR/GntR family transcriptional regulator n=1 Tax=Paucisalibacillus sp. EB02 TaxID=1347087 RepID=UPI0005A7DA8C|nr:GntR family transcriptional regulator [Paucisalibacillus sp. EB02]
MSPKQKVYQGVLQEIRKFIEVNDLKPGDKLPSERELSDKLGAGRSSIREALRAMELIGIIETRHGGGTFLSKYRPYHTVELLSTFILSQTTKDELLIVKELLEKEAAKLIFQQLDHVKLEQLKTIMNDSSLTMKEQHYSFFKYIVELTDNQFLARIWGLINEYSKSFTGHYSREFYMKLIKLYKTQNYPSIEGLFNEEKTY